MRSITTLPVSSYAELYTLVIFGIGALIVYILPLVAILGWEARQARQSQGINTVMPYVFKSGVYSVGWLIAVTIFVFALIMATPSGGGNAINGLYGFFHIDWFSPSVYSSVSGAAWAAGGGAGRKMSAETLVVLMFLAQLVYMIFLVAYFVIIYGFAYTISPMKARQQQDDTTFWLALKMFAVLLAAILVFDMVLNTTGLMLEAATNFAVNNGKVAGAAMSGDMRSSPSFDIQSDLFYIVKKGITVLSTTL